MGFKPGVCPNPGGRRKDTIGLAAIFRTDTVEARDAILAIGRNNKNRVAVRLQAWIHILDRGHGKPQQYVEADLRVEAVRVTAGAEFDRKILEAVVKLGRNPDGTALVADAPLEQPTLDPSADDDEAMHFELPTLRKMMSELGVGQTPARRSPFDKPSDFRSFSDSLEPT